MKPATITAAIIAALARAGAAIAHPGHGAAAHQHDGWHFVLEPEHAVAYAAAVVVIVVASIARRRTGAR